MQILRKTPSPLPVIVVLCATLACAIFILVGICIALANTVPVLFATPHTIANVTQLGCISDEAKAYAPLQVLFSACDHAELGTLTPDYTSAIFNLPTSRFLLVNFATGARREIPLVPFARANLDPKYQFGDVNWRFITPSMVLVRDGYTSKTEATFILWDLNSDAFTAVQLGPQAYAYQGFDESLAKARELFKETDSVFYLPNRPTENEFDLIILHLRPDQTGKSHAWLFGLGQEASAVKKAAEDAGLKVMLPVTPSPLPAPKVSIPNEIVNPTISSDGRFFADYHGIARVDTGAWVVKTDWKGEYDGLVPILFVGDGKVLLIGNGRTICPFTGGFGCPVDEVPTPILIWREPSVGQ